MRAFLRQLFAKRHEAAQVNDWTSDRFFYPIPPLDPQVKARAVAHLQQVFDDETKAEVRAEMARDREGWSCAYHFGWGMVIRNSLRQAGIRDDELPTGNWDDYWVEVVEAAVSNEFLAAIGSALNQAQRCDTGAASDTAGDEGDAQ